LKSKEVEEAISEEVFMTAVLRRDIQNDNYKIRRAELDGMSPI
jgi:hypothetical protein